MCYPWINKKLLSLKNIFFSLLLLLPVPASLASQQPLLMVMGDSLSAAYNLPAGSGWVSLLEQHLQQQNYSWQVVNASVSGETTGGGLTRLPELLRQHRPQIVLLELGANDGLRGQPPQRISANLDQMIQLSQQAGAEVLLLGILLPPNYGPRYLQQFEQIYPQLARQHQLPLVPFLLEGVADKPALMQSDGLHPTAEAQSRIFETVWVELKPLLN
jgi:acyl-CoA thioesterase-1